MSLCFIFIARRSSPQPPQVGAYTLSGKIRYGFCHFGFKPLFKRVFFIFSQFFLAVQVHTFMVFLTNIFFVQYSRRLLILKLGGPAEKWGLLLAQTAPTLENHRKSMKNQYFLSVFFPSTRYDPTDCIFSTHSARFRFPPQRAPSISQNA